MRLNCLPLPADTSMPGIFTISIDLEAAWGICDLPLSDTDLMELAEERSVVRSLLDLFEKHDVKATWAVVGHLLEQQDPRKGGDLPHPDIPRPIVLGEERDWFFQLPPGIGDPDWYGADMVEMVKNASPPQEIGSHSFSHMPFDESAANRDAIDADLAHARAIHDRNGLTFDSFVFPRNVMGFRDLLARHGLKAYRGATPRWYDAVPSRAVRRLINLSQFLLSMTPPAVKATKDAHGLINIPDSMLLFGRRGIRKLVPPANLVRMARRGLDRAAETGDIFHLWFHPSNFATETDIQMDVLEQMLEHGDHLRQQGKLRQLTMAEVAAGDPSGASAA